LKRAYVDIAEGQVHYRYAGAGEPLLLLHQVPASSDEYSLLIPYLARSFRVLAMDTMGYGMSDPLPPKPSIPDYARCVTHFLEALGIKKTNLFGHHTGASIAIETAAAYPEVVDKLVLSGCPLYAPDVREQRRKLYPDPEITADGAYIMEMWGSLRRWNPDAPPEFWHKTMVAAMLPGAKREYGHQAVFNFDERKRLPLIKAPTLVLSARKDAFINLLDEVRQLIPRSRTGIVEGAGSMVALVQPEALAKAITEFIRQPGV
jgi:pimeloyl-ACP methyl ester carboxylesterase